MISRREMQKIMCSNSQAKADDLAMRWAMAAAVMICLLFGAVNLFAANKNVGTSGAQFLKIGAGARPVGMGETFTGVADDINAVAWNPAGLGRLESPAFTAMHTQWLQASNFAFLAAAYPFHFGTIGVSMTSLTVDKIDRRAGDTFAPDSSFDSMDSAYTLSYGMGLGEKVSAGLNLTSIRQKIDTVSASAVAGDAGLLWKTPVNKLTLGASVRHFGSKVKFVEESDPLPMTMSVGFGYKALGDRLTMGLDLNQPRDNNMKFGVGAEFRQPMAWQMAGSLRGGYNSANTDPTSGLTGVSFGMGLSWRNVAFDMAWVPYGILGNTFRYAFLVKF